MALVLRYTNTIPHQPYWVDDGTDGVTTLRRTTITLAEDEATLLSMAATGAAATWWNTDHLTVPSAGTLQIIGSAQFTGYYAVGDNQVFVDIAYTLNTTNTDNTQSIATATITDNGLGWNLPFPVVITLPVAANDVIRFYAYASNQEASGQKAIAVTLTITFVPAPST